jgi:hypothetical protein
MRFGSVLPKIVLRFLPRVVHQAVMEVVVIRRHGESIPVEYIIKANPVGKIPSA